MFKLKLIIYFTSVGTYRIHGQSVIHRVIEAGLKAGYRAFDTAAVYRNEEAIGLALKTLLPKFSLSREDIFLTTKLGDHGVGTTTKAVKSSLKKLGTSYVDLYLVHWPGVSRLPVYSPDNAIIRSDTWRELVTLHRQGLLRAIGISNYTVQHLKELIENSHGVIPAVNQVEYHPHYKQPELLKFCQDRGILLQAYCSLGGSSDRRLLEDATVGAVAKKLDRSPAQVLLCWALQQGIGVIPKSVSPDHISDNIKLDFIISESDMVTLNSIPVVEKYAWDPTPVL
ncbi:putative oxidoreductase [Cryptotermes secundus]|uniref:Putative oxidoreductase n=1 Tax=Cryptotermes secundus TaxID=105785 RepID=A0A2J7RBV6_9NEOP|nr:putative oxidoreductase [Cryptotermes secundus]